VGEVVLVPHFEGEDEAGEESAKDGAIPAAAPDSSIRRRSAGLELRNVGAWSWISRPWIDPSRIVKPAVCSRHCSEQRLIGFARSSRPAIDYESKLNSPPPDLHG
jgi:hypothetical protein